ncbi:MAG: hypothetical protein WD557_16135 [Dehalococcoidia bacterium]
MTMFANLTQPGGFLGIVTVVCAFFLFVAGVVSVLSGLSGLWSDNRAYIVAFGALNLVAVGGLGLQPRMPWLGAVLVIPGAIAFALAWFWAILPLVIGPVAIVAAVIRAVKLSRLQERVALAT